MSKHLPECIYKPENIDPVKGIRWGGSPCVCDELRAIEQRTLDAAREAVRDECSFLGTHLCSECEGAVAAIDALRESK